MLTGLRIVANTPSPERRLREICAHLFCAVNYGPANPDEITQEHVSAAFAEATEALWEIDR